MDKDRREAVEEWAVIICICLLMAFLVWKVSRF
jgi:hypothetical protein